MARKVKEFFWKKYVKKTVLAQHFGLIKVNLGDFFSAKI
jgi:hypothetical protein